MSRLEGGILVERRRALMKSIQEKNQAGRDSQVPWVWI